MNHNIIGEGKTAKVYLDGNKAIKLYLNSSLDRVKEEAQLQTFAAEAGLPVPKILGISQLDEGIALEMEYVQGSSLMSQSMDKTQRMTALKQLADLQHSVHNVNASALPKLSDRLAGRLKCAPGLDDNTISILQDKLAALDTGKTNLCHGDFHPLNIIKDGEKLWIIDWVDATCGDLHADICRSYIIFKYYISRIADTYLRLSCAAGAVNRDDVLAWLPIIAAVRLTENLDSKETAFILTILRENMG